MTHSDIIIIVITLTISSTFGVYVAIKKINQYTRPPVSTLNRQTGDIEIIDYIEPSQPVHAYYPIDLSNSQYINCDNMRVHSYLSGNPPSYHTNDRIFINSLLENSLNLEFIFWFIIFMLFFIIISYISYIKNQSKPIFTNGIFTDTITFVDDYQDILNNRLGDNPSYYVNQTKTHILCLFSDWTVFNIKDWIDSLEEEQDYGITIRLISKDTLIFNTNVPTITISKEFIVNKGSNPVEISSLISIQLETLFDWFESEIDITYYLEISYSPLVASR